MDAKSAKIFEVMVQRGLLPSNGSFEITEELLEQSFWIFRELFPPKRNRLPRSGEKKLSRKIAGLNLMSLLEERTNRVKVNDPEPNELCKSGFVYVISNPSFPGMFKVGMTTNIEARLRTYQTYDPHRSFKIESYQFVLDRRECENMLLNKFKLDIVKGEWVTNESVIDILVSLE